MRLAAILTQPERFDVVTITPEQIALALLERMRETPMRRGALSKRMRLIRDAMSGVIAGQGVLPALSQRVAFQLAFKFHARELGGPDVWAAIGRTLRQETAWLQERIGLADVQVAIVLPKLSATQLLDFLEELTRADRRIARTILNAAVDAADPLMAGRHYLAEYRLVARQLRAIDPTLARTVANATFTAGMPLSKAIERLGRLSRTSHRGTEIHREPQS
jgi:hypothetical protein